MVAILYSSSLCLSHMSKDMLGSVIRTESQSFIHQVYVSHGTCTGPQRAWWRFPSQSFIHQVYVSHMVKGDVSPVHLAVAILYSSSLCLSRCGKTHLAVSLLKRRNPLFIKSMSLTKSMDRLGMKASPVAILYSSSLCLSRKHRNHSSPSQAGSEVAILYSSSLCLSQCISKRLTALVERSRNPLFIKSMSLTYTQIPKSVLER